MDLQNEDLMIFIAAPDRVRAVRCSYNPDEKGSDGKPRTSLFKTFNLDVKVGDFVAAVTDNRHKMSTFRVEEIVNPDDIDFRSTGKVPWVIDVIDVAAFEDMQEQEKNMLARVRSAQKRAYREELQAQLVKDAGVSNTTSLLEAPKDSDGGVGDGSREDATGGE